MNKKKQDENMENQEAKDDAKPGQDPKDAKIAELTDTLQRLQAEFENYKKRVEKEKEGYARYCNHKFIFRLLPLLDTFELAIKNSNAGRQLSQQDFEKFRKGIEMIYAQFYSTLEAEGLRPINAVGQKLDPYRHEVLMQQESDKDDIILEEFQKGYMLNDIVIRHSKVKIGKKKLDIPTNDKKEQGE